MCLDALAASKRALDDMSNGLLGDLPPKLDWGISQLFSSPRCHVRHWLHRHMMSQRCPIAFREAGGATQSHQRLPHSGSADTVVLSCTRRDNHCTSVAYGPLTGGLPMLLTLFFCTNTPTMKRIQKANILLPNFNLKKNPEY